MKQDHDDDQLPVTEALLRRFLALYRTPEELDPETLEHVARAVSGVLGDNRARKIFGLPPVRGWPKQHWRHKKMRMYVALAECYGHSRTDAMELARAHFGRTDERELRRIVNGTTFLFWSDDPADWQAYLERWLPDNDHPPKPVASQGGGGKPRV